MDWCKFDFKSDSGRYDLDEQSRHLYGKRQKVTIYYRHWLQTEDSDLLCQPVVTAKSLEEYEEFDTLFHVTSYENISDMLKNGFRLRAVQDSSVVNSSYKLLQTDDYKVVSPRTIHPLSGEEILWYGPGKSSRVLKKISQRNDTVMLCLL